MEPEVVYFVGPKKSLKTREWEFLTASKEEAIKFAEAHEGYIIKEKRL